MRPSEEYTIKILESEDFDVLPYDDASGSLGLTDMKRKVAFIRRTGVKDMDIGTIHHEFDELMQQTSPHEVNGIRYKKSGNILRQIVTLALSFVPGIGPGLSAAATIGGSVSDASKAAAAQKKANQASDQFSQLFQPSAATQAFAPQSVAAPKPLSLEDFNTSLSNLDRNRSATQASVFERFRGLGTPQSNTAFGRSVSQATTSSEKAKSDFLEDQRKLGSTFV